MVGGITICLQTSVDVSSLIVVEEFGLRRPVCDIPITSCCKDDSEQSFDNEDPSVYRQRERSLGGLHLPPTSIATNAAHETNTVGQDTTKGSS